MDKITSCKKDVRNAEVTHSILNWICGDSIIDRNLTIFFHILSSSMKIWPFIMLLQPISNISYLIHYIDTFFKIPNPIHLYSAFRSTNKLCIYYKQSLFCPVNNNVPDVNRYVGHDFHCSWINLIQLIIHSVYEYGTLQSEWILNY